MNLFDRVKKLARSRGLSIAELERQLNLSPNILYKLKNQKPSTDRIETIADFFDVSVDYLLGRTDEPRIPGQDDMDTLAAHHDGEEWTEEELKEIEQFKEFVRLKRKQQE
ncbi:helix-turn-helix domain-containing protein [Bacillus paralicheniformis]|uniref:helix-turn-helix domain-containing protein n=1 Tax=Bacillus paralicheniformis TaxID=1648923 RepID=UPI002244E323|nr:helix-turn-helix transcriptional regulator [Bacillus paralicheniformis]MEC1020166.1 helix-turn-helix transcriptional regulator [Bacillus paralicheniformis]MEC1025026.1 helix-turn-helix transcriptional regulator [Bacillus paralicheniformis]MEC1034813.1 helix-turn-helix transcriptional regulator [Bacillus paralicheniformis]MEC1049324.1 helix-turn-helix transcriptional regulator [Bacillus paralicheniformis]MEC1061026.1 helix-turn-helix transcriptional regulator [Bacillus paralicheniformis]